MLREWFWRNAALATTPPSHAENQKRKFTLQQSVEVACQPVAWTNCWKKVLSSVSGLHLWHVNAACPCLDTSKILYLAGLALGALLCAANSVPFLWSLQVSGWLCVPCMEHVNKPLLVFFRVIEMWFFISVPSDFRAISVWVSGSLLRIDARCCCCGCLRLLVPFLSLSSFPFGSCILLGSQAKQYSLP